VKAYILTTGVLFGAITIAHLLRMFMAEPATARDPWYLLLTVAAAALCLWAFRLLWRSGRKPSA
jgi:hypothetical protein